MQEIKDDYPDIYKRVNGIRQEIFLSLGLERLRHPYFWRKHIENAWKQAMQEVYDDEVKAIERGGIIREVFGLLNFVINYKKKETSIIASIKTWTYEPNMIRTLSSSISSSYEVIHYINIIGSLIDSCYSDGLSGDEIMAKLEEWKQKEVGMNIICSRPNYNCHISNLSNKS